LTLQAVLWASIKINQSPMKSLLLTVILLTNAVLFAQEDPNAAATQQPKDSIAPQKANELGEITIYGNKRQYIKVDSDKTTVDVKNNAMLNSGSSMDAIKKLPGVITSPTGSLTLNGKAVAIYIDGSPSTLSGTDLQNYLSSLPAGAIEKVELIYNPGAAFDANSSGSVINIVTSSKRLKGVNASFNVNYNFNKYQKPSPQILMNGKEKNLSWQTMIGYNYIDGEQRSRNKQVFTTFPTYESLDQKRFSQNTWRNFYFRSGLNYKLSPQSNLLFNYNVNFGNNRDTFESSTIGTGTQAAGINYFNQGVTKEKSGNHEISLQYKTKLDTLGRTLDVTAFSNFFDKNPISGANSADSYNKANIKLNLTNYYLKYDFAFPFEKYNFSINTGGKFNNIEVKDNGIYNSGSTTSTSNSAIAFDYTERNLAFYAEARKKIKKFNFTAGLRYENFHIDRNASTTTAPIKYTNSNLFPTLSALYEVNENVNVSASYSRKISQPNYFVLDPNTSSAPDQYNNSKGNPFLRPTFFDNYEFKVSAFQFVQLGANYTVAKDNNMFLFDANPGELRSITTFQQFDKFKTMSAFLSFPIPIDYFTKGKDEFQKRMADMDKMNYVFINVNYIKSLTEGYNFSFKAKPVWNYSAQSQLILPWGIKNSMSYFILPQGGTWEIYKITKPIQQFDVSFNKDFMNKNLKIGLHCFDVFNQNEVNALVSSTNIETQFYQKPDTRNFRISLTYNFGNLKLDKEDTNINTEKVSQGGGLLK
jgi:iron complex outermembrane receptor protein